MIFHCDFLYELTNLHCITFYIADLQAEWGCFLNISISNFLRKSSEFLECKIRCVFPIFDKEEDLVKNLSYRCSYFFPKAYLLRSCIKVFFFE